MKHRLLVTTALEPSWGANEEIVFLGEWCKKYTQKHVWQTRISQTVNYHWRDRNKLKIDHSYLEIVYEELLSQMSSYLNQFHKVDNDPEYWRIVLGPWLLTYIPVLWDRWELLSSANKNKEELTTKIVNQGVPREIANDYSHAIDLFDSDLWNHQIFASMLDHRTDLDIKIEAIEADVTKNVTTITSLRSKLRLVLKRIFNASYQFLECLQPKKNRIIFFHSYFPKKSLFQLYFRLGLVPRSHNRLEQAITYPSRSDRKNIGKVKMLFSTGTSKNSFESFVSENIIYDIPVCHLEGYDALHKIQVGLYQADNIFTANAHFGNELFKVWAAEQKKLGSKLIISSHGGALYPLHSIFNHQEKIADFRIVWGREWIKGQIRLPANKLNIRMRSYRRQGNVSLIDYDSQNYSYRCASIPMGSLSLEVYNQNKRLINLLSPQIKSKLRVRPKNSGKWQKKLRYIDDFGSEIISSEPSLKTTILNSRLLICSYPQTTFAEAMFSGVPTMIVFLEEFWEVQPIYKTLISILKDARIMHTTEISAANHIAQIYDDPMEWWKAGETQAARSQFNDLCLTIDDDPIKSWVEFFEQLPNGDIKRGGKT